LGIGFTYGAGVRLPLLVLTAFAVAPAAQAQVLFEDDFESGTLLQSEAPPGKWSTMVTNTIGNGQQLFSSEDAGFASRYGLRLVDTFDAGTGIGNGRFVRRPAPEVFGNVYLRYRVRLQNFSGSGGPFPIQLHTSVGTIAEMALTGSPAVARLNCADTVGFRMCPTTGAFSPDTWHVVQLGLEGLGTPTGRCSLRVDDQQICEQPMQWTGRGVTDILAGSGALDRSWDGVMDVDQVLMVQGSAPATRLSLSGPAGVDAGECVVYRVSALNDFDGGLAVPARPTQVSLVAPGLITAWPSISCAGDAGVPLLLDGGQLDVGVVFGGPSRTAVLEALDLTQHLLPDTLDVGIAAPPDAGAPDAGILDAGSPDAGSLDAGPPDAGEADAGEADAGLQDAGPDAGSTDAGAGPATLSVGCGCSGTSGTPLFFLLAVLLANFKRVARRPARRHL
jgi:hypothetical protein